MSAPNIFSQLSTDILTSYFQHEANELISILKREVEQTKTITNGYDAPTEGIEFFETIVSPIHFELINRYISENIQEPDHITALREEISRLFGEIIGGIDAAASSVLLDQFKEFSVGDTQSAAPDIAEFVDIYYTALATLLEGVDEVQAKIDPAAVEVPQIPDYMMVIMEDVLTPMMIFAQVHVEYDVALRNDPRHNQLAKRAIGAGALMQQTAIKAEIQSDKEAAATETSSLPTSSPITLLLANAGDKFVVDGLTFTVSEVGDEIYLYRDSGGTLDSEYEMMHVRDPETQVALFDRQDLVSMLNKGKYLLA